MKLSTRDAAAYFRKPDPNATGLLIFGADAMRVAERRKQVLTALVGPDAETEMRLTRINGSDLRKEPALLLDAVKAVGFFPGPRAVHVESAVDGLSDVIATALTDWKPGDAQIIATAGALNARSALRKLFESHRSTYAAGIYDDPPSRQEVEQMLSDSGLRNIAPPAAEALSMLSRTLEPGDFRQTLEKVALYKSGDDTPLTPEDVDACAPRSTEADLDDLFSVVAEARKEEIALVLSRLYAQGVTPVTLCIGATRFFRTLHALASDPGGPSSGAAKLRPPLFGPKRDRMVRQAERWGRRSLEKALQTLTDTDLQLRSASRAPQQALVERALLRLALTGPR
ncbi:MAG: DNA polymerase III subunit delta [Marivivens sp.]|nr:DNA polymerase III subunit delta [Marivivens sp.]